MDEVWVKVGQTSLAPIVTTYRGPKGYRLVVKLPKGKIVLGGYFKL
jgi:hypothetical protein